MTLRHWRCGYERSPVGPEEEASGEDLTLALALREGLRAAMAAHRDNRATATSPLEAAAAALPLRLGFVGTEPHLQPVAVGVRGALAKVLIAIDDCRIEDTWSRLKLCPADDCAWAFYDSSKNRTRVWCAMGVCGNRTKNRAYRARRRSPPNSAGDR